MGRRLSFVLAAAAAAAVVTASPAVARKPVSPSATCSVAGTTVSAVGLPTGELVNFLLTDADGTSGWVLGYTPDGTWQVSVPAADGPTTYQFVSRTSGPGGRNYTVFASC